jgi:nucleotide-binding universal stress UspA family protein
VELRSVARRAAYARRGRTPLLLVATNYSPSSCAALRLAAQLASTLRASLVILRVLPIETYAMSAYPTGRNDGTRVEIESQRLDAFWKRALGQTAALPDHELAIAFGKSPHRVIAEMAEKYGADLIVMGAHRGGIKHAFVGSVSEKTRRVARCPVLTANADARSSLFGG